MGRKTGRRTTMNAGPRRLFAAFVAVLGMAVSRARRLGEHRRHHRPVGSSRADREQRLAGRDLHERTARQRPGLLGRHSDPVLRTGRRPSPTGASPSSSSNTPPNRAARKTGRRSQDRPGRPAGRAERQPRRDRTLPAGHVRSRRRADCPRLARSAKASSRRRWPAVASPPQAGDPGARLQRRPQTGRAVALRPRTRRQRSLPRRGRRLGRRLPRGIHDPRPALDGLRTARSTGWS